MALAVTGKVRAQGETSALDDAVEVLSVLERGEAGARAVLASN